VRIANGELLLIDESYNANPASMTATLKSLGAEQNVERAASKRAELSGVGNALPKELEARPGAVCCLAVWRDSAAASRRPTVTG